MRQRIQKLDLEIARAKALSSVTPEDEYRLATKSCKRAKNY